ncbi:DedA family protein [Paenibacillus sp. H1-7]|uniref:DedA family protein n=1 Tax=Paenibacillus sp. H1-7 TaxID=2282849 RepID=UPI001EF983E9|nr:DedA family protein [Paenibacillus sp. H1-7]ULL15808.1 DedA family protein [Paenibacillus sp. H1-7]
MKLLQVIEQLFAQYGYWVLLIGLPLDAIASPIPPGNTTLTYTGYLAYKGVLKWLPAVAAAYAGAVIGMTVTYWIGYKLGVPLVERYGRWLLLKPDHLEKTRKSYGKYGNRLLFISYFMPGVRQFIGYFAGIIRVPYSTFALYAYTGSALWVIVFIGIGFIFGDQWQAAFTWIERFFKYIFIGAAVVAAVVLLVRWRGKAGARVRANKPDRETE